MSICQLTPLVPTDSTKLISIPGSKSDTNRALVISSLVKGKTTLQGLSESDDSRLLMENLNKLGINFFRTCDGLEVHGNGGHFKEFKGELNCGIAGTTGRFLAAVSALVSGEFILTGEGKMLERPMKDLFDALKELGCRFEYLGKEGCLPVRYINQKSILGGKVALNGSVSSQFFTALLLIAPVLKNDLEIEVLGEQVSKSYIDMTQGIMSDFGVNIVNENYKKYIVDSGHNYQISKTYRIDGDASGCSYFWGIAAISGQGIRVQNISPESVQGDVKFPEILKEMGCTVISNAAERWIEVKGPVGKLKAIEVDMENMPDTAQTLAVVASFAEGRTMIKGLSTLKGKETDRLQALKNELSKIGIESTIGNNWIEIIGDKPKAAQIETYKDHRMAMSFAVAGSKINRLEIVNPEVVTKSFPDFWNKIRKIGMEVKFS